MERLGPRAKFRSHAFDAANLVPRSSLLVPASIRHVEIHDELPSTNDRAIQLTLFAALETPALIVARRKLAGRGHGTHQSWSADGALTFSLILEPQSCGLPPRDWPKLSLTTAVAVCDALRDFELQSCSPNPQSEVRNPQSCLAIKWPNEVLIDGAKICDIHIESPGGPAPAKDRIVISVGININNAWHGAPRETGQNGTSLRDVTGRSHDADAILLAFIQSLDERLNQLGHIDCELPHAWRQLSWLTDRQVEVDVDGCRIAGKCIGIANDGALLIASRSTTERIYSGAVRHVS